MDLSRPSSDTFRSVIELHVCKLRCSLDAKLTLQPEHTISVVDFGDFVVVGVDGVDGIEGVDGVNGFGLADGVVGLSGLETCWNM